MFYRRIVLFSLIAGVFSTDVKSPRIVIVGAGAAGIAAASKLLENGLDNILILEAEDRIGGRVNTIKFDDYMIDMGAQWIHGDQGNIVYDLVSPLNITDHSVPYEDTIYTSTGELIDPKITKNITNSYIHYLDSAEEINQTQCQQSLGECFENKLRECFTWFPELNDTMKEDMLWLFNMMQISLDPADSWYDISATNYWEYEPGGGDQAVNWKERGYSTILDILMKKFPNPEDELPVLNKTILNAEVTNIDYSSDDNTVKITTHDGKEYVADHVIMTPSLGVLKAQYETLFTPSLPESKVRNIKGLGFGHACKIYLLFNDTWFNPTGRKNTGYRILWSEEDRKRLDSNPKTRWMPYAFGFFVVEHKPRLLYVWVSGKGARLMNDLTDDEVFDQTEQLLYNLLSKTYNVSKPVKMIRSKWAQNKHFRGTYSYRSMDTVRMNCSATQLSEPIMKMEKPIILFGGEATNEHTFSTVHGAIGSGWREAGRLINIYGNNAVTTESTVPK